MSTTDVRQVLPAGTELDGKYIIERVIGSGGFGVTYAAHDIGLNTTVALKEYYPADFGARDQTMSVRPKHEQDRDVFERLRQSFVREARTLAQFKHPAIVRVLSVFESHGTAYMVMEYEEGQSLKAWLNGLDRLPMQDELDRIAAPLLDALEVLHRSNFLHRDIAPDNIILRPNGTPVLLDFGAARRVMTDVSNSMTGVIKQGYSPQEQYATDARLQGPWTDIYALGATFYHAVTGAAPPEAMARALEDTMVAAADAAAGRYRQNFLAGIDAALTIKPRERPQSIAELREILLGSGVPQIGDAWHRVRTEVRPPVTEPLRTAGMPSVAPVSGSSQPTPVRASSEPVLPGNIPPPDSRGRTGPLIGAAVVGGLVVIGLIGAYHLGTRQATTVATIEPGVRKAPELPKTQPVVPVPSTVPVAPPPPEKKAEPTDVQRDAIVEEARRRAEEVERQRRERERQAGQPAPLAPRTAPPSPPPPNMAEIERRRVEQSKRNRDDKDYSDALKYANGTDGVTRDYLKALPLFEKSAAKGNPDAMNWIGWIYFHGRGVTQDYQKAREWYQRAADAGHATGMNQMGWMYQNGFGVPRDLVRSIEWYQKAATAGSVVGMYNLGSAYQHGRGAPVDFERARQWYELAAAQGDASAMSQMGWLYQNGLGLQVDYVKAREWYEKAANAGSSSGMNQLGWLYQNGLGQPRDYQKAREWYEKGAAARNGSSMNQLGWIHANGLGVPRDHSKAREWYEKAANAGNVTGMYNLASAYENGQGVPRDYGRAREWYEKAAAAGDHSAMSQIGWLHQNGFGTPTDYRQAREWYEKAAAAGNGTAMNQLGWIYQNSLGVPQDYQKAREWYERSAAAGNGSGMNQLGWIYANGLGVPKDLARARQWYEKAAAAGKDSGIWNLALQLDNGQGGPPNHARAAQLLLRGVRIQHATSLKELQGTMDNWDRQTRIELKRELLRLGFYKGSVDDTWDDTVRRAVDALRRAATSGG